MIFRYKMEQQIQVFCQHQYLIHGQNPMMKLAHLQDTIFTFLSLLTKDS